jgi:putative nucleotidyltransferase with HDIG domain
MGKRESLQALAPRLRLPALPQVVARINAMLGDRECGPQEIGRVVGSDPGLTARVLRIANSSVYGLQEQVVSTEQAATVIGVRALRNLVLQASIARRYEHLSERGAMDMEALWEHAMEVARLAQMLGTAMRRETALAPDEFHTCGLLHDLGKAVLLDSLGDDYGDLLVGARDAQRALHHVEAEQLGFSHVDVGALLSRRWGLPREVAQAVAFHHGPLRQVLEQPHVAAVAVADQLAYRAWGGGLDEAASQLAQIALRTLDITPQSFERVVDASRERWRDGQVA